MKYVTGDIFSLDGFERGYLGFDKHHIVEVGKGSPPEKSLAEGFIVPTFVNAHTHIGDSFIKKKYQDIPRNITAVVAPPNGLKHRLLNQASKNEILQGMEESLQCMINSGISSFCDFREGGIDGIQQLKHILTNKNINSVILSRPKKLEYNRDEIDVLLTNSDGIGLSSITDWQYSELEKIARHAKRRKKFFALHGSEAIREDIDLILDLKPNFLIHMIKATKSDLIRVKENNISVVVCPRSNAFFGLTANIHLMKQIGIDVMLGTDNAMVTPPNIIDELHHLKQHYQEFTIEELLTMITYTPRKALNLDYGILDVNLPARFIVLDKKSLKPRYISV